MDWFQWRVVRDSRIPDGVVALRSWTFVDLLQAHIMLDALDEVAEINEAERERAADLARIRGRAKGRRPMR